MQTADEILDGICERILRRRRRITRLQLQSHRTCNPADPESLGRWLHADLRRYAPDFMFSIGPLGDEWDDLPENAQGLFIAMAAGIIQQFGRTLEWNLILRTPEPEAFDVLPGMTARRIASIDKAVIITMPAKVWDRAVCQQIDRAIRAQIPGREVIILTDGFSLVQAIPVDRIEEAKENHEAKAE